MRLEFVGGLHSVKALLEHSHSQIFELLIMQGRRDKRLKTVVEIAIRHGISVTQLSRAELTERCSNSKHQGVVAVLRHKSQSVQVDLDGFLEQRIHSKPLEPLLLLVLDEVQDPHNLGACLRSADAAGVDAVVVPAANSVGLTPVVRKVASGAAETIPFFQIANLQRGLQIMQARGLWVYGASAEATTSLYALDLSTSVALVMGAEGKGLRRLTRERCDALFHLPMAGSVSSLNVSVASGITLYEAVRQRGLH